MKHRRVTELLLIYFLLHIVSREKYISSHSTFEVIKDNNKAQPSIEK